MSKKEPTMAEMLAAANKIDSNIQRQEEAAELEMFKAKHNLVERSEEEQPKDPVAPTSATEDEALADLYPNSEESENGNDALDPGSSNVSGENGNAETSSVGNQEPAKPDGEQNQPVEAADQGQSGEVAPVTVPEAQEPAAPPAIPSPWETQAEEPATSKKKK